MVLHLSCKMSFWSGHIKTKKNYDISFSFTEQNKSTFIISINCWLASRVSLVIYWLWGQFLWDLMAGSLQSVNFPNLLMWSTTLLHPQLSHKLQKLLKVSQPVEIVEIVALSQTTVKIIIQTVNTVAQRVFKQFLSLCNSTTILILFATV